MTLLLAHPTPIIGDGLQAGLQDRLGVAVTVVNSRQALLREAPSAAVRAALVDESLLEGSVADLCGELLDLQVPMILMTAAHEGLLELLACGVRGVVDLRGGLDGVIAAVQAVQDGLTYLPPQLLSTVLLELIVARRTEDREGTPSPVARPHHDAGDSISARRVGPATLSHREVEVLRLLCDGADQTVIARSLTIAPSTVKTHIARIVTKLGAHSRVQAVEFAMRSGLVNAEETRP